jgi:hypothetical protein
VVLATSVALATSEVLALLAARACVLSRPDVLNSPLFPVCFCVLTRWFHFDNTGARGPLAPANSTFFGRVLVDSIIGRELYDHRGDSGKYLDWTGENINLVNYTEHADVVIQLHQQLLAYIQIK